MSRLPIYKGAERNSRVFTGKGMAEAFSVTRCDWELYLKKFFMNEDRFYTEKEWTSIIRNITLESEMLKGFYRNMTGMDYVGEDYSSMVSFDKRSEKNTAEYLGQAGQLRSIIVFYERFILFASSLIGNDKVNLVETKAA